MFILCGSDVIFVINHCLTRGNSEPRISVVAHGSGAAAGFLLGFIVYTGSRAAIFMAIRYFSIFVSASIVTVLILFNTNPNLFSTFGVSINRDI